jgi:PIN domain
VRRVPCSALPILSFHDGQDQTGISGFREQCLPLRAPEDRPKSPPMGDETKILFADTNGFLQVRDLKDIPWRDLFPGAEAIDVMVAPSVIGELDKQKSGTNQRRRDRARLALQIIEKASRAPDLALVIRDKPIRVRIVISTAPRFNWTEHPNLDPANPDDQLVADALSFGSSAAVFSHDTGPRIRARIAGIDAHAPLEEWLLPVEQTDDQRKITRLERDLERALSQSPNIVAGFNNFDEGASEIRIIVPIVRPLDPQQMERLVGAYLAKHPRASFPAVNPLFGQYGGTSDAQVRRYFEDYSSFQATILEYYAHLHEHVRRIGKVAAIDYFVKNEGGVVAEGLRIEFDLEGNGSLLAKRVDGESFNLPEPPERPRSVFDSLAPDLLNIPTLQDHMKPRDPIVFYWFERPKLGSKHSARQCQEFRATREYRDSIFVRAFDDLPAKLVLRMHISAANLPSPVNITAKLVIAEQAVEWSDPIVKAILTG